VSLVHVKALKVTAVGPGEIAGSALAVTVRVDNRSSAAIDADSAVVTLIDSAGNVGTPTTATPASPFVGSIPPGSRRDAVYVFTVAVSVRNPINVVVSYSADAPAAHFAGNAA